MLIVSTSSALSSNAYASRATPHAASTLQSTQRKPATPARSEIRSVIDDTLPGQPAQVVGIAHDAAMGAGIGNEHDIVLAGRRRQATRSAEHVAGFADRSDHVARRLMRLVEAAEIVDGMVSTVQRRPHQRVHARI